MKGEEGVIDVAQVMPSAMIIIGSVLEALKGGSRTTRFHLLISLGSHDETIGRNTIHLRRTRRWQFKVQLSTARWLFTTLIVAYRTVSVGHHREYTATSTRFTIGSG